MAQLIAVFDLDGTLLDTLDDLAGAVNRTLSSMGFPPRTRDEVRAFVGNGVSKLMRRALPADTDEATFNAALAQFKADYAAHNTEATAPYPGILDLLAALRAEGVRTAVVSNKFDAATRALCARYFGDLVEVAVGENEAAGLCRKPAPDTVFAALTRLGVATTLRATTPPVATLSTADGRPVRAVYIGDSDVDIATATAAGLPCLSVTWGFRDEDFLRAAGATTLAHTPEELERFMRL